jgi:branched-chain amino acid aminotransferase
VVQEAFGAGTAAVVTPVGTIGWGGKDFAINGGEVGPITRQFYKTLTDYQYGKAKDPYGWVRVVAGPGTGTETGKRAGAEARSGESVAGR